MQSSEFGDERPIWACQFSPSGMEFASAAWSGLVKLWTVPACQKTRTIKAHDNRITGEICAWRSIEQLCQDCRSCVCCSATASVWLHQG